MTEEAKDKIKERAIEYAKSFGVILAINILSTWLAAFIIGLVFGALNMTPEGRSQIKESFDIHYLLAYLFMLAGTVLFVLVRRTRFTWGDAAEEWVKDRPEMFKRYSLSYIIISLPVDIYYIATGISNIYFNENTTSGGIGITKINAAEPLWISNFFAPQAAFFRLTQSLILGLLLNFIIYFGVTAFVYFKLKMKKSS